MTELSSGDRFDVERVRDDFPILHEPLPNGSPLVYLDNAATAQKPRAVIDALVECYSRYYSSVHRGMHTLGRRMTTELEATREKVRRLVGAESAEEIIFTAGTTMSINLVAWAWGRRNLGPGEVVLVNEMEHHANLVPWQEVVREKSARLRFVPVTDDGQLDLSRLDDLVTSDVRLVAVSGMSNVFGTIHPIAAIATAARRVGARVLVDGAQSVPHLPTDVLDPRIDFLAFSAHKLYGPSGVGVLYARSDALEEMDPFLFGGNMIQEVHRDRSTWAKGPAKFESGTPPAAAVIGLGAAIDYVDRIGFEEISRHERRLVERAMAALGEIPDLDIFGPPADQRGSIVSFVDRRVHPQDMAALFDRLGLAIRIGHHCAMPLHQRIDVTATGRASFAFYNTDEEVDALVDAIGYTRKRLRVD